MSATSIFEIFKIGIGPSSSHTVGPMKAAREFAERLIESNSGSVARVGVNLYGSLALTGRGHATDTAIILGLSGEQPEKIDPDRIPGIVDAVRNDGCLQLLGNQSITFSIENDINFLVTEQLDRHTNGMRFTATDDDGNKLLSEDYFSIGCGFIARNDEP